MKYINVKGMLVCVQHMSSIDNWGIDVFRISDLTNHRPLTAVTYTILQVISLHNHLSLQLAHLYRERSYHSYYLISSDFISSEVNARYEATQFAVAVTNQEKLGHALV